MSSSTADPARTTQLRLLRALDEAAAKLEASDRARHEPIAIIGAGCRLPGGVRDLAAYWRLLYDGVDATSDVPEDRWEADEFFDPNPEAPGKICTRRGSFLTDVDRFDAVFFGLSPREAAAMDPQQRLLLEVAHEALDSAGRLGDRLDANATGVFVGLTNCDYGQLLKQAAGDRPLDAYFVTGNAPNAAAGRISYLLGLRGPSLVIDTACSSSLVTVHLACQSLRAGECSLALAGGANLILAPEVSVALSRARMLAPDGRCKTFDAAADGYARGEGAALVALKRLSDAQRDGDRVLAVIRGSAVNQDGPSSGFTVPSGAAQRSLLRAALAAAKLTPADIDYVEVHGTGTALGDPIEVGALGAIFQDRHASDQPLLLGSVKTNLGHLESAAGIAGLLKVALALAQREIPAHLNFRVPSPHIAWAELPVAVAVTRRAWPATGRPRRAGVSSFGVSGTNAHVLLEEAPAGSAAVALPAPRRKFFGERHWAPPRRAAAGRDWLYTIDWVEAPRRERERCPIEFAPPAAIAARVQTWLGESAAGWGGPAYAGVLPALEQIAAGFARQAATVREVVPGQRRLQQRLQEIAARPDAAAEPGAAAQALLAAVPAAVAEVTLLARCGGQLTGVLRGRVDPLTLLFPAGESITAASLYRDTPAARAANMLVQTALGAALPPGRPVRVLEIGAGTGGTTDAVLPGLEAGGVDYVFTDVSPLFVAQAAERYRDRPGVRARPLDIERDPLAQGFSPGEFDVVLAANVLHATQDVRAALRHAHTLLAAGGLLVLLEATAPLGLLDLTFGLTEGWWRFADGDLRPAHALLPAARWPEVLHAAGFGATQVFSIPATAGEIFAQQSVFLTRAEAAAKSEKAPAQAGDWLLVSDGSEVAAQLQRALVAAGASGRVVPGTADFAAELATLPAWRGVLHTTALDAGDPGAETPLRSALALAQALTRRPAPVYFLTRGAGGTPDATGLAGAGLGGFARTLAQEHPELRPVCLDWDAATEVGAIVAELLRPDGETQIVWQAGARRVARLKPLAQLSSVSDACVRAEGSYLIVGGLGGLGLQLARWLAERGAKHLILAGRSAPGAEAEAMLRELRAQAIDVRVEHMDVARQEDVARVLAGIAATPWPLRGVVHAAGVLDDGILQQQTWARFAPVLAPKVAGSWHLHTLTREVPLDWFVLFSSATGVFGSPGQANHAAACAFQDALARHRRALGLPALSIDWGPWAEIGAAARREIGARVKTKGFGVIAPARGWKVLARLFGEMPAQVAVVPVAWPEVPADLTAAPFFSAVRARPAATAVPTAVAPLLSLDTLAGPARVAALLAEVRAEVARVLGLEGPARVEPGQGFFALGMDSLTSVELRNRLQIRLGRTLPATLAFDHPTAEKLAAFLGSHGTPPTEAIVSPRGSRPPPTAPADDGPNAPLAIVGLALRFPGGADTPEKLWVLLRDGGDAIEEVPRERWDIEAYYDADPAAPGKMYVRHGGFLSGADQFDAAFFGVSPREAEHMDPQQRLLLETSWEALERAGIAADALAGTATGVFVGICNQDYAQLLGARGLAAVDSYVGSGNAHSVAAGRLAYTLGLQGPAIAVDTACSSSLVAVHLAAQSLRTGECDLALAGGVNLLLSPLITVGHSRARMLAPDGRCKTFDAAADGFVRSEGCGMVVLKRLGAAQRDGDRILAVLRGSAVNQDGRTSGLTVPSGPAQQAVMRTALRQAGVAPAEVDYVEAHGTGTSLGDPIELGALGAVFGPGRDPVRPLRVGSIKTNIGHLESAAGVAGLIKVVLSLQQRAIPPHLHFRNPNPLAPWAELPVEIPTRVLPWPETERPRIAGVSSFGFGGTNAHLVVSEAPPVAAESRPADGVSSLVLTARTEAALRALARRYAEYLPVADTPWGDICQTAAVGRAAGKHRLTLSADTAAAAATRLGRFARGENPAEILCGAVGERPKVALLFSGQGSLYAGAGRELYAGNAVHRAAVDECRAIVLARAGWDVGQALESPERLARTEFGQVALFVLEYGLARVWQAWGVAPAAVVGHSVGEFAAACIAGVMTPEVALTLLIERARLMGALPEDGAMLAVSAGEADLAAVMARHRVELGAVNSPRQVVLTGNRDAIELAAGDLKRAGIRIQRLDVKQGYHSRYMEPMVAPFASAAASLAGVAPGECKFVSTVTGAVAGSELGTAAYWTDQIRRPVRFGAAMETLRAEGIDLLIEVGPRGILVALGQQTWPAGCGEWLVSLRPGQGEAAQLQESAGRAWVRGAPINWPAVFRDAPRPRTELPTYPFQRRRYWFDEWPAANPAPVPAAPTYAVAWEPQVLALAAAVTRGTWAISGDGGGIAAELQRRGHTIVPAPGAADRGVVFVAQSASTDLPRLLEVVRVMRAPARLWIVTRDLAGAVARGAGRVLALEQPQLGAGRIALGAGVDVAVLVDELEHGGAEDEVALRTEGRFVARLQRRPLPAGEFRARVDGTYLVTGGLGALGLRVAEWLVARGARHLVLLGRRAPSAAAEATLERMRQAGATVAVRAADVADRAALSAIIAECGAIRPPLHGVFHVAGVPGYHATPELDAATCAAVLRPKVEGARLLDELTRAQPLDVFVLFSSIAAVWGGKGQAHYAAANAFLDELAHERRRLGRPALSVAWGPWAGGGLATPEVQVLLAAAGVRLLAPAAALAVLDRALAGGLTHVVAAEIDWAVFRPVFESRGPRPLLGALSDATGLPVTVESGSAPRSSLAAEIAVLAGAEQLARLRAHVQQAVGRVLKLPVGELPDPHLGFADQGIDSLMAIELKNRLGADLGLALPATLVFDHPDVERLTRHLLVRLQPAAAPVTAAAASPIPGTVTAGPAGIAGLSDEEVEALLIKKLDAL